MLLKILFGLQAIFYSEFNGLITHIIVYQLIYQGLFENPRIIKAAELDIEKQEDEIVVSLS